MRRFLVVMVLALAAQAGVFAVYYRDLLALRQPAASLAATPGPLDDAVEAALARPVLTRRHLETIADASRRAGRVDLEVRALARLVAMEPADPSLPLRYGDALRRAGRLPEAEAVFRRLLDAPQSTGASR